MKRIALLSLMLLIGQPALADGGSPNHADIELSNLLPPPPAAGSTAARQDLQAVLAVQRSRTPAEQSAAKADMERSVFRFADVLGPSMQPATLPKTAAFFERVADFDKAEVKDAKLYWRRARPPVTSDQVHPLSQGKAGRLELSERTLHLRLYHGDLAGQHGAGKACGDFCPSRPVRAASRGDGRAFPERRGSRPTGRNRDRCGSCCSRPTGRRTTRRRAPNFGRHCNCLLRPRKHLRYPPEARSATSTLP